jgi:hypothetical protein
MNCCGRYHPPLRFTPNRGRTVRLREGIGDVDDDGSLDLDLDQGDDDHVEHLSRAAASIFRDESLSNAEKLAKLKLLLKVGDAGEEPDDGEPGPDLPADINASEASIRRMYRRCRRMPRDPRSNFEQLYPGLGALPGMAVLAETTGALPRGRGARLVEAARPRAGKRLTTAAFLRAIEGGR